MKNFFILLCAGLCFCLQVTDVKAQLAKHHWLNAKGVNYTLSPPTSDGHWVIAAPKQEQYTSTDGGTVLTPGNNMIAVMKVKNPTYEIINPVTNVVTEEVAVIGLRQGTGNAFNREVHFEVHSVVQSRNPDTAYVLCGAIKERDDAEPVGMVAVLNSKLELTSLRRYDDVKVFYSVYAQDGFYFVCGQMKKNLYSEKGVVLRDSIIKPVSPPNIRGFYTSENEWAFHKIVVRKDPAYQTSSYYEFSVSGYSTSAQESEAKNRKIGYAVFQLSLGNISYLNGLWFGSEIPVNSKTTLAYYPPAPTLSPNFGTGLLLSVSKGTGNNGGELFTYVFNDNANPRQMDAAFKVSWDDCILEDMDCNGENSDGYGVAWVGNNRATTPRFGEYVRTNIPVPYRQPTAALLMRFLQYYYNSSGDLEIDKDAFYSLHKVHFFPDTADYLFHGGGYYESGNDPNVPCGNKPGDRAAFVVTPEGDDIICSEKQDISVSQEKEIKPQEMYMGPARVYATTRSTFTQWYGFCTMDCEGKKDNNCGNRLIE
jgi:hypothetical protein